MIISYQGGESVKISQGDLSLAVNPTSNRGNADLTLMSTGGSAVEGKGFVISGPGEYEVKDISVKGFLSEGKDGKINTVYLINFEGLNLCFLGSLSNPALNAETIENLEDIDILFVPVDTLEAAPAYKLAVSLEPSLIIPISYSPESLKKFLKEAGEDGEHLDKLVVKKKDLEGKEGDIVVLKEE
ncbi:MBL fold metallo-hydrolase [Candidatus Parcubacteria bacterium]|nr:MBL fold metallo-hydrolase [Candidatus Parcubacteria bacterium]